MPETGFMVGTIIPQRVKLAAHKQSSEEAKARKLQAKKRRYQNPEYKAKLLEKQRNRYQDPEIRAKKLESKRKRRAAAKLSKEAAKNEQP